MKIKKIVNLCKSSGHMYLYNGDVQMLGDDKSLYYLDDCPKFTPATLCRAHDITEKQADKMLFKFELCPPTLSEEDFIDLKQGRIKWLKSEVEE